MNGTWKEAKLSTFAKVKYGKATPRDFGKVPVIGSGGAFGATSKPLVDYPTLVIGRKGTAGKVWFPKEPSWPSDTTFYLEWKSANIDPAYLYYALQARPLSGEHARTTMPSIQRQDLEGYDLLVPPLAEQKAIADVLQTVQGAKEARQRELTLERERKAALMEHLFSHGTCSEASKQSEIGDIPESWQVVEVDTIAGIGNGSTPSRSEQRYWKGGTIPWITSTKVHEVVIRKSDEFVTEVARRECHLPLVPKKSLVVAITGQGKTLGNAAILEFDTCINQHLAYIHFTDKAIQPYFALYYFRSKYQYLRGVSSGGGSTKGALTCGFLKRMKIPVPPEDEQVRIAKLLSSCEMKCDCLEKEIALLDEFFAASLDELLYGRLDVAALIGGGSNG